MPHTSLTDPNAELPIDEDTWAVSILRKPKGSYSEHTFIVVEGENQFGKIIFCRYDLVIDEDSPDNKYKIIIKPSGDCQEGYAYDDASLAREGLINTLLRKQDIVGFTWSIAKSKAKLLANNIAQSAKDQGSYSLFGLDAVIPKSGKFMQAISPTSGAAISGIVQKSAGMEGDDQFAASLSSPGHNCFTWARWQLYQLDLPQIQNDLPRQLTDFVISVTSRHLNALDEEPTSGNCLML